MYLNFYALKEIIGADAATILFNTYYGQTLCIPKKPNKKLTDLIGIEKTQALISKVACEQVVFPSRKSIELKQRHDGIRADRQSGYKINQLVQKYGYSVRYIFQILQ